MKSGTAEEQIRAYTEEHGIKLSVLARRSEIPAPVLYRALGKNGKQALTADQYIKVCAVLGIEPKKGG